MSKNNGGCKMLCFLFLLLGLLACAVGLIVGLDYEPKDSKEKPDNPSTMRISSSGILMKESLNIPIENAYGVTEYVKINDQQIIAVYKNLSKAMQHKDKAIGEYWRPAGMNFSFGGAYKYDAELVPFTANQQTEVLPDKSMSKINGEWIKKEDIFYYDDIYKPYRDKIEARNQSSKENIKK